MVEVNYSFERGDEIRVRYEETQYNPDGTKETVEREDTGKIIHKPSKKFNWPEDNFDFDYEIDTGAVRSIDIENETVAQLMYEGGGDRDWDQWNLLEISRIN